MKDSLKARRRQVMRNLKQVNREIKVEENGLKRIAARLAMLERGNKMAA
jgi:hypothetical protein